MCIYICINIHHSNIHLQKNLSYMTIVIQHAIKYNCLLPAILTSLRSYEYSQGWYLLYSPWPSRQKIRRELREWINRRRSAERTLFGKLQQGELALPLDSNQLKKLTNKFASPENTKESALPTQLVATHIYLLLWTYMGNYILKQSHVHVHHPIKFSRARRKRFHLRFFWLLTCQE